MIMLLNQHPDIYFTLGLAKDKCLITEILTKLCSKSVRNKSFVCIKKDLNLVVGFIFLLSVYK